MGKGVDWRDMHALSKKIAVRGLRRLGILQGNEHEIIKYEVVKVFFPHGLGHLLGLNVHDDGLGLDVQVPPKDVMESLVNNSELPVQFHYLNAATDGMTAEQHVDLPPPSSRRNRTMGSSLYATPKTRLEPGMLLTVEPGIYFNPAQIKAALADPCLGRYLDETAIHRYMGVGGVRIEDVVLILRDGSVENITNAPKNPWEVELLVREGQREYKELQQRELTGLGQDKQSKEQADANAVQDAPQGIKKRVGMFKKLLRAIRNMF